MSHRGKTFAFAAAFFPASIRLNFETLYTFCRYVDDCADECCDTEQASMLLENIKRDLERKSSSLTPVTNFLQLAEECNIPLELPLELVRGVKKDIFLEQIGSEQELLRYCYQVAGTVGLMVCFMLGVTDQDTAAAAIDLGIAMQLTNIARDVKEDFISGRIYLPADLVNRQLIGAALEQDDQARAAIAEAVRHIIVMSKAYYESSDRGMCRLPASTRLGILAASRGYGKIGQMILARPDRCLQERVSTGPLVKTGCLLHAVASFIFPAYGRVEELPGHRQELHECLRGIASFDAVCP